MRLVNIEGGIYRMTKRNLRAYLGAIRSGESPNINRFGSYLGLSVNVTDMNSAEASVELEVLDGEAPARRRLRRGKR